MADGMMGRALTADMVWNRQRHGLYEPVRADFVGLLPIILTFLVQPGHIAVFWPAAMRADGPGCGIVLQVQLFCLPVDVRSGTDPA